MAAVADSPTLRRAVERVGPRPRGRPGLHRLPGAAGWRVPCAAGSGPPGARLAVLTLIVGVVGWARRLRAAGGAPAAGPPVPAAALVGAALVDDRRRGPERCRRLRCPDVGLAEAHRHPPRPGRAAVAGRLRDRARRCGPHVLRRVLSPRRARREARRLDGGERRALRVDGGRRGARPALAGRAVGGPRRPMSRALRALLRSRPRGRGPLVVALGGDRMAPRLPPGMVGGYVGLCREPDAPRPRAEPGAGRVAPDRTGAGRPPARPGRSPARPRRRAGPPVVAAGHGGPGRPRRARLRRGPGGRARDGGGSRGTDRRSRASAVGLVLALYLASRAWAGGAARARLPAGRGDRGRGACLPPCRARLAAVRCRLRGVRRCWSGFSSHGLLAARAPGAPARIAGSSGVAAATLLALPFLRYGYFNDLVMRASIPALFTLAGPGRPGAGRIAPPARPGPPARGRPRPGRPLPGEHAPASGQGGGPARRARADRPPRRGARPFRAAAADSRTTSSSASTWAALDAPFFRHLARPAVPVPPRSGRREPDRDPAR